MHASSPRARETQVLQKSEDGGGGVAELEWVQTRIVDRIPNLELSLFPHNFLSLPPPTLDGDAAGETQARLYAILKLNGVAEFTFRRVPSDYHDWPLESRRDVFGATSVHHHCKSIVLLQNLAPEETSIKLTGYEHNAVTCIGMETNIPQTTFVDDCLGSKIRHYHKRKCPFLLGKAGSLLIKVILGEAIGKLHPDLCWLGGGEIDLKLGIWTSDFVNIIKPFIVSCSGT